MILIYYIVNNKDIIVCIGLEDLIDFLVFFLDLVVFKEFVGFVGIDFRFCSFMFLLRLIRLSFLIIEIILSLVVF